MKIKGLRWWVIGLIALATVINYIDRQALPVLWPDIAKEFQHYLYFHTLLVRQYLVKSLINWVQE